MIIASEYEAQYPIFSNYITTELMKQRHDALIIEGMQLYGQLSKDAFVRALTPGELPKIAVADLDTAAGIFYTGMPDWIGVHVRWVERFEKGEMYRLPCKSGGSILVMGLVILHELIHWGDFAANATLDDGAGRSFKSMAPDWPKGDWCRGCDLEVHVTGGVVPPALMAGLIGR
jgi:hypothetical protein